MEVYKHDKPPERPVDIPDRIRNSSLRFSIYDASFFAMMVGFGEAYFIPFLIAIGSSNFQIGIFTAIPHIFFATAQFASLNLVERYLRRKPIILAGASTQALFVAFFVIGIFVDIKNSWLYIGLACGYYASMGLIGPAWNSLIGDLTHAETRGAFFGKRSGLSQLVLFLSILAAGIILQYYKDSINPLTGFMVIFAISFVSRILSVICHSRHYETPYKCDKNAYFSLKQFLSRTPRSNFARFVFFLAFMSLAVQIAAPFFATYMLRDLQFSYIQYMIALGAAIVAQFITMRRWGPFADRYGNRIVLRITGMILPIIPVLWLFSSSFVYILFIQVISGVAWAGWMLASANFIFDAVTPQKRARCAALLNAFNSTGIFLGALTGAYLSKIAPSTINTGAMQILFLSPLEFLFIVSAVVRFIVAAIFLPIVREVRDVEELQIKDAFLRLTNVRPAGGVRFEPYTGYNTKDSDGPIE
jgi:MFS family permease